MQKLMFKFSLICSVLIFLIFMLLITGPINTTFIELLSFNNEFLNEVILTIRIPKIITAMLAGSALAVSGLIMQTYFSNPLADPFVLGINSGASLGVAVWMLGAKFISTSFGMSFGYYGEVTAAILGSFFMLLFLLIIAQKLPGKIVLLVVGLLAGHLFAGVINVLISLSEASEIKTFLIWGLGSFQNVTDKDLIIFVIILLPAIIGSVFLVKPMNLMILGDRYASSMGLSIRSIKILLIIITAILSGTVTAFCGPIIFVGIIVPHLARSIFNTFDHRILLPAVVVLGAILSLIAEFLTTAGPNMILPINAVFGILSAPILVILFKNKKIQGLK